MNVVGTLCLIAGEMVLSGTAVAAMGWTNCHNEDKSITRCEEEIWGSNPIVWKIYGKTYKEQSIEEFFDKESKKSVSLTPVNDGMGNGRKEVYRIKVKVREKPQGQILAHCEVECTSLNYPNSYD